MEISESCNDLAAGTAAEYLVCADLLLQGHDVYPTTQICAYDLVADVSGHLIRVQVKATRKARPIPQRAAITPGYMWHVRRRGKEGKRNYADDEYDMLALVALDISRIAYMGPEHTMKTIHIKPPSIPGGKQFDYYTFDRALEGITCQGLN